MPLVSLWLGWCGKYPPIIRAVGSGPTDSRCSPFLLGNSSSKYHQSRLDIWPFVKGFSCSCSVSLSVLSVLLCLFQLNIFWCLFIFLPGEGGYLRQGQTADKQKHSIFSFPSGHLSLDMLLLYFWFKSSQGHVYIVCWRVFAVFCSSVLCFSLGTPAFGRPFSVSRHAFPPLRGFSRTREPPSVDRTRSFGRMAGEVFLEAEERERECVKIREAALREARQNKTTDTAEQQNNRTTEQAQRNTMSVSFSARIAVVNGFVVDKVDRKVISRSVAKNLLSRDKYAKLCQEYIRDKKILGEMPGQLLELDKDSELFQFVDCKRYSSMWCRTIRMRRIAAGFRRGTAARSGPVWAGHVISTCFQERGPSISVAGPRRSRQMWTCLISIRIWGRSRTPVCWSGFWRQW